MRQKRDWSEVVDRNPRGYVELNNGEKATYGPISRVAFLPDTDSVGIWVKWAAEVPLGEHGRHSNDWRAVDRDSSEPLLVIPNLVVPFVIEPTVEKGDRVRFGGTSILFIDPVEKLKPEDVEGLERVATTK